MTTISTWYSYEEERGGLEHLGLNREVLGSNPSNAISNLQQVWSPHVAKVSRDASEM